MQNKPFQSILPNNSTVMEQALERACADRLASIDINVAALYDPDECPAMFLPWLASTYRTPYWDTNWTEAERREKIKLGLAANRKKGVPWAVKTALNVANINAEIIQWWQDVPRGAPCTFTTRVWLNSQPAGIFGDAAIYPRLLDIVNEYKRASRHFVLRIGTKFTQPLSVGLAASMHATANQRANTVPVPIRDSAMSIAPRIATSMHATANQQAKTAPVPIRPATPRVGVQIGMQFRATMTLGAI